MRGWSWYRKLKNLKQFSITRTCGGDPRHRTLFRDSRWYYPHMRGWSSRYQDWLFWWFVLPAHAGVILMESAKNVSKSRITRTCGGDPIPLFEWSEEGWYYPHMRGWSQHYLAMSIRCLVLPAHAGVILNDTSIAAYAVCITRTCGGDPENVLKI